jgi:hypothetical protein
VPSPKRDMLMISRLRFHTSVCGPSIVTRVGSFCDLNLKYTNEDMIDSDQPRSASLSVLLPIHRSVRNSYGADKPTMVFVGSEMRSNRCCRCRSVTMEKD